MGDYGGEILNEVKLNTTEKEMNTTPAVLHNGNHHKVQECKVKVKVFGSISLTVGWSEHIHCPTHCGGGGASDAAMIFFLLLLRIKYASDIETWEGCFQSE